MFPNTFSLSALRFTALCVLQGAPIFLHRLPLASEIQHAPAVAFVDFWDRPTCSGREMLHGPYDLGDKLATKPLL